MCGRYQYSIEEAELKEIVRAAEENLKDKTEIKTGEIYPTNRVAILMPGEQPAPQAVIWGYPNSWNKGITINARSETAFEKKMFAKSMRERRCIIPASGFFEWHETERGRDKDKYLFTSPVNNVIYMAGLYNDFEGERRFVILTKEANSSVDEIHNRMPVILTKDKILSWLNDNEFTDYLIETASPILKKEAV